MVATESAITETWRDRLVEVVKMRAGDILPHPHNPKIHPPAQTEPLKGLLSEVGKCDILKAYRSERMNGALVYWDGHAREGLNLDEHWQVGIYDLSDREADLLVASFDPLRALAETDKEQLDALLRDCSTGDAAVAQLLSDLAAENGLYFGEQKQGVTEDESTAAQLVDRAAELQAKWQTSLGQIWEIGEHRLAIGDCTNPIVTGSLLAGEKAQAAITDPPFNVRDDSWDAFKSEKDFAAFTGSWLEFAYSVSDVVACFFADKFVPLLLEVAGSHNVPYRRALIWQKPPGSQFAGASLDGFWFDFEIIQVFGQPTFAPDKHTKMAVLEHRTVTGQEHGCEKPVALLVDLVDGYSERGGIVFEPFSGVGTTMTACEQLGRKCRATEKDPKSAAVNLERLSLLGCPVRRVN